MKLHYVNEHLTCSNYGTNCSEKLVELVAIYKGEVREFDCTVSKIVFVINGRVSYDFNKEIEVSSGHILFFPPGVKVMVKAFEDSEMLVCNVKDNIRLCDKYTPQNLALETPTETPKYSFLESNERVEAFLNSFVPCFKEGLRCNLFLEGKIKEMFFIFRAYYTKEELHHFFHPLMSKDVEFSTFVWSNYRNAAGVKELAAMSNYSLSRFNEKFKQAFGVPALKWLNEQKARNIYYELKFSSKSLDDISDEFHFASTSYLSTFCKQHFSKTPKEIRTANN